MSYIIQERDWRLEKRVPLALVFALLLQVGMGLVWAAQLDIRVARIEKDVDRIGDRLELIASHPREGGDPFANRLPPVLKTKVGRE